MDPMAQMASRYSRSSVTRGAWERESRQTRGAEVSESLVQPTEGDEQLHRRAKNPAREMEKLQQTVDDLRDQRKDYREEITELKAELEKSGARGGGRDGANGGPWKARAEELEAELGDMRAEVVALEAELATMETQLTRAQRGDAGDGGEELMQLRGEVARLRGSRRG